MKKTIYSKPTNERPMCETALRIWMSETGTTAATIARQVGRARALVGWWADGKQMPSLIDAFKLEQLSEGKVPVASWLGTELGQHLWNNIGRRDATAS